MNSRFFWQLLLLIFITFSCKESNLKIKPAITYEYGGITRGDLNTKNIYLVFTGHEYAEGGETILNTLYENKVKASFFFTGDFYRNHDFKSIISELKESGHYLGAHSDKHLLYCPWEDRSKLLVSKEDFVNDVTDNFKAMEYFGITREDALLFMPPFEWYNDSISIWTKDLGLHLVNFTSGTRSNADYTTPEMENYINNEIIFKSIFDFEESDEYGMNGFILLMHIGVGSERTEKFYDLLGDVINELQKKKYNFKRIDEILE